MSAVGDVGSKHVVLQDLPQFDAEARPDEAGIQITGYFHDFNVIEGDTSPVILVGSFSTEMSTNYPPGPVEPLNAGDYGQVIDAEIFCCSVAQFAEVGIGGSPDTGGNLHGALERAIDSLERAAEVMNAAVGVDQGAAEVLIDSLERHAEGLLAASERSIDSREGELAQDITEAMKACKALPRKEKKMALRLCGNLLASLFALLNLKDDPFLLEHQWKGGLAFFQVDPATDARARPKAPRILDTKERVEKFCKLRDERLEAEKADEKMPVARRAEAQNSGATRKNT
ncbi:MAG: hypothetical protein LBS68_00755 [Puniceicoccales bacterium]|jgi:hypothetical protein|nr:hypothetical protein [Puniceicoccales bacterium]